VNDAAVEDDRRTLMNDGRSVGDRVRRCQNPGNHQTDGRRVTVAVRHPTHASEIDDPGYSDSWEGPTAGQWIGVARRNSNANSNSNSNATPSEVDSRSELGCLAASVSCWSCPHQVGEGNLLLRRLNPWGHRERCDSWDSIEQVHQKSPLDRWRHAVNAAGGD